MSRFYFTKMSGSGNDFVLFDQKLNENLSLSPIFVRKVCDRRNGIGADGVILISESKDYPFEMTYYNSDGSTGSLCANGARCSLWYCFLSKRIQSDRIDFLSNNISYSGQVLEDERVIFYLLSPKKMKFDFKINAAGQLINACFCDSGSPHVVININDVLQQPNQANSRFDNLDNFPVKEIGSEIRYSPDFAPDGVNVNFIDSTNSVINIRSYERGVEDETLSCGTGIVASAIITFFKNKRKLPINFLAKSGDILTVDFQQNGNEIENISLTGPAKIIFNGEITI
ncbi:MAG: diaminopimelate epimerase [Ignavibacteria bacterium]|nr:diaminopimelate epimerase [Ignavibacteria bacterium]